MICHRRYDVLKQEQKKGGEITRARWIIKDRRRQALAMSPSSSTSIRSERRSVAAATIATTTTTTKSAAVQRSAVSEFSQSSESGGFVRDSIDQSLSKRHIDTVPDVVVDATVVVDKTLGLVLIEDGFGTMRILPSSSSFWPVVVVVA